MKKWLSNKTIYEGTEFPVAINPFAPEPPVTARADPRPFNPS